MLVKLKNIGQIKDAELSIGGLTVLCGENNTGKTYVTYNTFICMDAIQHLVFVDVETSISKKLLADGSIEIDLSEYIKEINSLINKRLSRFVPENIHKMMAANEHLYKNAAITVKIDNDEFDQRVKGTAYKILLAVSKSNRIEISKKKRSYLMKLTLLNTSLSLPSEDSITKSVSFVISRLLADALYAPFIITCERTGVAAFLPNFIISKIRSETGHNDTIVLDEIYRDINFHGYPDPMVQDIRFAIGFGEVVKKSSFIAKEHTEIIEFFTSITGGTYSITDANTVSFTPDGTSIGLTTVESSSNVRSLMELNFYLKHIAKKGHVLMIDEPELNLHPKNQRKMARLIARLVNIGINVFVTTHSDYIIRELNTLIMLRNKKIKGAAEEYGYIKDELLDPKMVHCYVAKDRTLVPMNVSDKYGIEVTSFDTTIEEVNRIQQSLLYKLG